MSSSRRIFLRSYIAVALLVLCSGMALEWVLESQDDKQQAASQSDLMQGSFILAQQYLLTASDVSSIKQVERRLAVELGVPATIHALADFANLDSFYQELLAGDIITLYDDMDAAIFYKMAANHSQVIALGPVASPNRDRAAWIVPVFYSLIALAVFLWTKPLRRDLEVLQDSAVALGEQDFSTRTVIPSGSWLQPLGQTFNTMAQRIQWLLQSHRELTQAVSHELRTPLARMRFSLEILSSADKADQQRHLTAISTDIDELNTLIDEMLHYAELDQDNLVAKLEPINISDWLFDYVNEYADRNKPYPLVLDRSLSHGRVLADSRLLKRALDNLVGNAMRYAESEVKIGCQFQNELCHLWVADDGPGIAKDKREAVFQAYGRLESDEHSSGFGLGLAIVKRVMDLHAGKIVIADAEASGAKISLYWPK